MSPNLCIILRTAITVSSSRAALSFACDATRRLRMQHTVKDPESEIRYVSLSPRTVLLAMLSTRPSRRRQPVRRPRHQQIRATLTRSDSFPSQHSCGCLPESPFYENELCRNITYRSASCAHNSNEVTIVGESCMDTLTQPLFHMVEAGDS